MGEVYFLEWAVVSIPLAGFDLRLCPVGSNAVPSTDECRSAQTGVDGSFEFKDVDAGEYHIVLPTSENDLAVAKVSIQDAKDLGICLIVRDK